MQVGSTSADFQPDERDPEVELVLTENDYTLKMWPYKFKAVRRKHGCTPSPAFSSGPLVEGWQVLRKDMVLPTNGCMHVLVAAYAHSQNSLSI